ncbi:hypothetical protein HPB47_014362 [Ixodes persulcatus]|uniref:Uncharacterized protein n=1 Tax=Ixodes persulcatus TaxID=34615 RepID=A0AC60QW66_IXOPE|nr:hypothetical protein HPB47_014362 [Ixodes persulcatus]
MLLVTPNFLKKEKAALLKAREERQKKMAYQQTQYEKYLRLESIDPEQMDETSRGNKLVASAARTKAVGLCLDFEVLSNYCHGCNQHQILDEPEEQAWQAFHSPVCEKNVDCSSHAMETEAALRIWRRTHTYNMELQFTIFLSDGDSNAYVAVSNAEVYGSTAVTKEDCTSHVAKHHGKTKNAAESLNTKIWMLCPKTHFAARTAVETATAIAVLWFNRGHSSLEQVLEGLGVLPSKQLVRLSSAAD